MFKKFIERPVLATVISILLLILGFLSRQNSRYAVSDIAPPSVLLPQYILVQMQKQWLVLLPIFRGCDHGVENMTYISQPQVTMVH